MSSQSTYSHSDIVIYIYISTHTQRERERERERERRERERRERERERERVSRPAGRFANVFTCSIPICVCKRILYGLRKILAR